MILRLTTLFAENRLVSLVKFEYAYYYDILPSKERKLDVDVMVSSQLYVCWV